MIIKLRNLSIKLHKNLSIFPFLIFNKISAEETKIPKIPKIWNGPHMEMGSPTLFLTKKFEHV